MPTYDGLSCVRPLSIANHRWQGCAMFIFNLPVAPVFGVQLAGLSDQVGVGGWAVGGYVFAFAITFGLVRAVSVGHLRPPPPWRRVPWRSAETIDHSPVRSARAELGT